MKRIYKRKINEEYGEDTTKFGEFVCTSHDWLPLDYQKQNAKRLEEITRDENNRQ